MPSCTSTTRDSAAHANHPGYQQDSVKQDHSAKEKKRTSTPMHKRFMPNCSQRPLLTQHRKTGSGPGEEHQALNQKELNSLGGVIKDLDNAADAHPDLRAAFHSDALNVVAAAPNTPVTDGTGPSGGPQEYSILQGND